MFVHSLAKPLCFLLLLSTAITAEDAVDRLTEKRLTEVHAAIVKLATQRKEIPREGTYKEYRANLHVHSLLSHDSRITLDEVVAAAKLAGTDILMFTEHPSDAYDFVTDGHSGLRDGVLLIPGAENKGLLVYPRQSIRGLDGGTTQQVSDLVRGRGGLTFLSHLEERMDLDVPGMTGNEIYNTHFDFKSQPRLVQALKNPLWWVKAAELFKAYPQECVGALQNYPSSYLERWDVLCQRSPHTGVSANDAHQNIGICIRLDEKNQAIVEDALGEKVLQMDANILKLMGMQAKEQNGRKIFFETLLDPYAVSLKHVATHLLMKEQTVDQVWDALENGRAFVAFDWVADSRGFDFAILPNGEEAQGKVAGRRYEMGERVVFESEMKLVARAPLAGHWKLIRDGALLEESDGESFTTRLTEPGIYRTELWLNVAGRQQIWILSNPIYVSATAKNPSKN